MRISPEGVHHSENTLCDVVGTAFLYMWLFVGAQFLFRPHQLMEVRRTLRDACEPEENEDAQDHQQGEDTEMAWKRLRPSALRTVCQSMYIGASISLLTATIIGSMYMLISYVCYQTTRNCEFHQKESIPVKIQWLRTLCDVVGTAFLYMWFFVGLQFLFRPHQLRGRG